MKRVLLAVACAAALGSVVLADTDVLNTKVERYRSSVDTENQGGCIAKMEDYPRGLRCGSEWATFDCTGQFMSQIEGKRNFETAKEAHYLDRNVTVKLDDDYGTDELEVYDDPGNSTRTLCLVQSIEVHPEPEPDPETEPESTESEE